MRAKDFILEGDKLHIKKSERSAMRNVTTMPNQNMNNGSQRLNYRFGLAMAGAPDFPTKAENWIGGDPLLAPYTEVEMNIINYAAQQVGDSSKQVWSNSRSQEMDNVNKISPVSNWMDKKNE
jgi:hypothetical protein